MANIQLVIFLKKSRTESTKHVFNKANMGTPTGRRTPSCIVVKIGVVLENCLLVVGLNPRREFWPFARPVASQEWDRPCSHEFVIGNACGSAPLTAFAMGAT